ncbi:phosphoribosylanthranilate isomerase [Spathaspora passalidarum NRRL Y-27907]|uniref:N-(5'-phosphoribosyl)anthranilate isomerase n=1 Tax=Spathaspora passalidarum (strain NRRL Y-27907 / 11-Y1) TaxID=619300 RepID=G3AGV1_SPAPN|nr:phosphoribosylanthranilate isomerase [Spathaspora passalidarum NRRL Y-27907]EGW34624.1 phosphoribosylanthranilate isomerase [Spathaspora passalidarum NRRL Y-27907]
MPRLVKICGLRTVEAATTAIDNGADLLGCILVPGRKRTIDFEIAKQISSQVKQARSSKKFPTIEDIQTYLTNQFYSSPRAYFELISEVIIDNGPFLVGVFQNQPIDEVVSIATELELDFIQLHGNEDKMAFFKDERIAGKFGIIPRYVIPTQFPDLAEQGEYLTKEKLFAIPLLDSEAGGEGKIIDWSFINDNLSFTNVLLAGGLTPENLLSTQDVKNVVGYDVSGGVEDAEGNKDLTKIKTFITIGKDIN